MSTLSLAILLIVGGFGWVTLSSIDSVSYYIAWMLVLLGAVCLPLSVLPSDKRCIPIAIIGVGIPSFLCLGVQSALGLHKYITMARSGHCSISDSVVPCWSE